MSATATAPASTVSTLQTVGQLVAERPARSRLFEKLGIDYCCGGKKSLDQACREKNLDPATIAAVLDAQDQADAAGAAPVHADGMSLTDLADHVEATHHAYLKNELPRLAFLTQKVANAHGASDARLGEVARTFAEFRAELESHMNKEERVLFPAVRALESGQQTRFHFGVLANPIGCMEDEHARAGQALELFRKLTDDYTPPAHACNTYRATLDALKYLEQDMHQHVHKENNILFPKAQALEAQRNRA